MVISWAIHTDLAKGDQGVRAMRDAEAHIKALRHAARMGIADIESGRYRAFDSPNALLRHLAALRDAVLSRLG